MFSPLRVLLYSADAALRVRFNDTTTAATTPEARQLQGRIAPSAVIIRNGQRIGLVGATTQVREAGRYSTESRTDGYG